MEIAYAIGEFDRDVTELQSSARDDTVAGPAVAPPTCDGDAAYSDEDCHSVVSIQSTASENWMAVGEDRSNSSLSSSHLKSRIPLLRRSASLRERKSKKTFDLDSPIAKLRHAEQQKSHQNSPVPTSGGLYRSASFATSRGLTGIYSPNGPRQQSLTCKTRHQFMPSDAARKAPGYGSSYVSPYSRKSIAFERKMQVTLTEQNLKLNHANRKEDLEEDSDSVRSFGSDRSTASCDVGIFSRNSMWGSTRPQNVLHCRHTQDNNADEYLTPTQRATRKIRELKIQLKSAHREIAERDVKIAALTKEVVELRINKAEDFNGTALHDTLRSPAKEICDKDQFGTIPQRPSSLAKSGNFSKKGSRRNDTPDRKPSRRPSSSDPRADSSLCVTPPSDGSEPELRMLKDSDAKDLTPVKDVAALPSPEGLSLEDSESCDLTRSLADSGHYEGVPSPCFSAKDSLDSGPSAMRGLVRTLCSEDESRESSLVWSAIEAAENRVRSEYERRFEELQRNQMNEYHELKEKHNDHVENLLAKLSEANLRLFELRPLHEKAQERVRELEKEREKLKEELRESEVRHQKVYLQMYLKGQEAARIESEEELATRRTSNSISQESSSDEGKNSISTTASNEEISSDSSVILGLMKQLAESEEEIIKLKALYHHEMARAKRMSKNSFRRDEIDPEITLQFLKSAIYYFLTDKDNSQGHLRAIESILGYSSTERVNISRHVNG